MPPDGYRPPAPRPPTPGPTMDPYPELTGDPEAEMFNEPPSANADPCDCSKQKKKKKRAKEREVCRQGTYTQRKKGIKYAPRRVVPCEGEIQPEGKKKSKPKARRPATALPGLSLWS
jgi:hypothetical protein